MAAVVPVAARAGVPAPATPCGSVAAPATVSRTYSPDRARTYDYVAVEVPEGTTRIEVGYRWVDHAQQRGLPANPATDTLAPSVLDLGLWEGGTTDDSGFRGWSGSRQGRLDKGQAPVWVAEADAERGYVPGPITPGPWFVEVGVAAVGPDGATVEVQVACRSDVGAGAAPVDPVDPDHVADPSPGWFHGDFHLHAFHSHPCGPAYTGPPNACGHPSMIAQARAAGLDIVPVTEYVTTRHWGELGPVQRANPDLLVWPGREIITYQGHAVTLNDTGVAEYRHGHDGITLPQVQRRITDAGGLFGVAHPTIFPGPLFRGFCRGCELEVSGLDWDRVDTIEVLTGPAMADLSDAHGSFPSTHGHGLYAEQPFIPTAIDFWEDKLLSGHKIAPVSGSDSKGVDGAAQRNRKGYGSSATAVRADRLSVAAVSEAIRAGRVYVRARGVDESPELDLAVRSVDGAHTGTFGSVLPVAAALMDVQVRGAAGQVLRITRNGDVVASVPIAGADQTITVPIHRSPGEERAGSRLGTFWRVDTVDARGVTTIGNAVFLAGPVLPPVM